MEGELFLRGEKVPMTKEVVRALALSKLELHRANHLINVGTGTGSVSIEVTLQYPELRVTAIERNPIALKLLDENHQHFACANIDIFPGVAPMTIAEKADTIFMDGSDGHLTELISWSIHRLHPAERLAITFILQGNLNTALAHLDHLDVQGVDCLQLQTSSLTTLSNGRYFKPNNPVFITAYQKEGNYV